MRIAVILLFALSLTGCAVNTYSYTPPPKVYYYDTRPVYVPTPPVYYTPPPPVYYYRPYPYYRSYRYYR
jgi:hypothetical protein